MKNLIQKVINTIETFAVVTTLALFTATYADDTEIFYTENMSNNLLFVLDTSGSMDRQMVVTTVVGGGTTSSGGKVEELRTPIAANEDDATQTFEDAEEESEGEQNTGDDHLNFVPGNLVATRFHMSGDSIYEKGKLIWNGWIGGFRYSKLKVKNVRITNAYLKFYAAETNNEDTTIKITVEDVAHNAVHNSNGYWQWDYTNSYYHPNFPTIIQRAESNESVTWQPANWTNGTTEDTVVVTDLVQHLVDRSDWNRKPWYENSFAFKFETQSGNRAAYSTDGSWSKAPLLHIEFEYDYKIKWYPYGRWYHYNNQTQTPVYSFTRNRYEDAEQEEVDSSSNSIELYEPQLALDSDHNVGLRFNLSKTIPQDAVILESYMTLTAAADYTNDATINIQTKNTGSAGAFSTANPILGGGYDGGISWTPNDWVAGLGYKTPDLTTQIQAIVDNGDVGSLAFRLFNEGASRNIYSFDQSSDNAPKLFIKYQNINGATSGTGTGTDGTTVVTEVMTRLEVMQQALENVLRVAPEINVGLMKYSGMSGDANRDHDESKRHHYVGGVVYPVSPIYEKAEDHIGEYQDDDSLPNPGNKVLREYMADVANRWEAYGGTPIVDALYEAALYFRGEKTHFGRTKNNTDDWNSSGAHPASLIGGTKISSYVGDTGRQGLANPYYNSPIKNECQSSYIVLMSDGYPTNYYDDEEWGESQGPFARFVGGSVTTGINSTLANSIKSENPDGCLTGNGETGNEAEKFVAGTCGREITQFLATNDQMPDSGPGQNTGVEGDQFVKTFVIGFGPTTGGLSEGAEEYLKSLVTVDGNGYFKAEHKQQLETAFLSIFDAVSKASNSLSSPGYSVNVKSGLEHEDEIYIPVFDRKNTSRWSGNLKKFKLVDDDGKRKIRGKNHKDAFDEYGVFSDDALDYWSNSPNTSPDGYVVEKGGVAEKIDPEGRKIFSDLVCSGACELNTDANKLVVSNSNLTVAMLGLNIPGLSNAETANYKTTLVNFMRGWENGYHDSTATNDADKGIKRHYMGDMLHTEPLVITYAKGASDGTGKKQFILAATNEGYLHVFDVDSGEEKFVFAPKDLLTNSFSLFSNAGTARDHKYGIDGTLTYWHGDTNKNGNVDDGEKVYLYFGLRRGGRAYYALDISDINKSDDALSVKLLWKKTSADTGMSLLGQTWSAPYLAKVGMSDGTKKQVMIVSGGYDKRDDRDEPQKPKILRDSTTSITASMGNNIFILDMENGDLLWDLNGSMTEDSPLNHSIPGGIRILDVNRNGLIDRMYFADTGGFVWRLDLSESLSKTGDDESKLTKFASLAGDGDDARKFYNEPDVATMSTNGKTIFVVSVGSGFRAHPQDKTIEDKFFVLKDTSPYYPLNTDADDENAFVTIEPDDMATVTVSGSAGSIVLTQSDDFGDADKRGWYVSFPENTGEKVLATSITVDGVVAFTTMVPKVVTDTDDVCAAPVAEGRLYGLNILTGEAGFNLIDDSDTGSVSVGDEDGDGDGGDTLDDNDAYLLIVKGEIPGKPQIVFNSVTKQSVGNGSKAICSHPVDIRNGKKLSQVTGYDACRLESVYWNDPEQD